MGEYEDLVQRVRDAGLEDDADELERLSKTDLRRQASRSKQLEAENAELKATNRKLEMAPKKEAALRKANVDLDALRPAERQLIQGLDFEGDEPGDDWVAKVISDYQLPVSEGGDQQQGQGEPNAQAVVRTASTAPAGGPTIGGTITPETVAGWSTEEQMRFADKHPEAWEQLKAGEEVAGVTTS